MVNAAPTLDGSWLVAVIARRTYRVADGRCAPADEQVALVEEQRFDEAGIELVDDIDITVQRTVADLVVRGHAWPLGAGASFEAAIRSDGGFARALRVRGERGVERDAHGALRFTPAEAVERVALRWGNAFGGLDAVAYRTHGDPLEEVHRRAELPFDPRFGGHGYPRNPVGTGYVTQLLPGTLEACRLPLLEEPGEELTPETLVQPGVRAWPRSPRPACTELLPYAFFPRSTMLGFPPMVYDPALVKPDDIAEVRAGLLTADAVRPGDPTARTPTLAAAQQSALGMRCARVAAGEVFELDHLHPRHRQWRVALPGECPRVVLRHPGREPDELAAEIQTVVFEPDLDRVTVVWVAKQPYGGMMTVRRLEQVQHAVMWR